MTLHRVTGEDYPPGGIGCVCEIGHDHDEAEMEER